MKVLFILCMLAGCVTADPLRWIRTPTVLPTKAAYPASVYNGADAIYTIGGTNGAYNDQVYKYNVATGTVEVNGRLFPSGLYGGVPFLHGDQLFYLGGWNGAPSATIFNYSTSTGGSTALDNLLPTQTYFAASAYDPDKGIGYILGGRTTGAGYSANILKYDANTDQLEVVDAVLPGGRSGASAVFAGNATLGTGIVYVFGGQGSGNSYSDIIRFDPTTGEVALLSARLPHEVHYGCAVYAPDLQAAFIIHAYGLIKYNAVTGVADNVEVDTSLWPGRLEGPSCVYVEESRRMYVFGGVGHFPGGEWFRHLDAISYIEVE